MNKACRAAAVWAAVSGAGVCLAAEPSVTNVRAEQRRGTAYVDFTYDPAARTAASTLTSATGCRQTRSGRTPRAVG